MCLRVDRTGLSHHRRRSDQSRVCQCPMGPAPSAPASLLQRKRASTSTGPGSQALARRVGAVLSREWATRDSGSSVPCGTIETRCAYTELSPDRFKDFGDRPHKLNLHRPCSHPNNRTNLERQEPDQRNRVAPEESGMQTKRKSRLSAAAFNSACIAAAVILVLASLTLISM